MTSPKIVESDERAYGCSACGCMFHKLASIENGERLMFICIDCAQETAALLSEVLGFGSESYGDLRVRNKELLEELEEAEGRLERYDLDRERVCAANLEEGISKCEACSTCYEEMRAKHKKLRDLCVVQVVDSSAIEATNVTITVEQ